MSVEYNTFIICGFACTEELRDQINEATNYELEDNFIFIDSWSGGDQIFGVILRSLEPGDYLDISDLTITPSVQEKIFELYCKIPPELRWMGLESPRIYVAHRVS